MHIPKSRVHKGLRCSLHETGKMSGIHLLYDPNRLSLVRFGSGRECFKGGFVRRADSDWRTLSPRVKTLTTVVSSTRESSPMVSVHIKSFCKQIPPMRRAVQVELCERITDSIF